MVSVLPNMDLCVCDFAICDIGMKLCFYHELNGRIEWQFQVFYWQF